MLPAEVEMKTSATSGTQRSHVAVKASGCALRPESYFARSGRMVRMRFMEELPREHEFIEQVVGSLLTYADRLKAGEAPVADGAERR